MAVAIAMLGIIVAGLIGHWWQQRDKERSHDRHILTAAQRYKVDPALVKAVVWQESRFQPAARGRSGEIGLMQLMSPAAHEWAEAERLRSFRHEDLFDPGKNTLAGTWYLRRALNRYQHTDDPVPYALAEYNAGRSNVLRWNNGAGATNSAIFLDQITFPGTRRYVQSVMERHGHYRSQGFGRKFQSAVTD
jgi:soluble lytic murein transglycosylase